MLHSKLQKAFNLSKKTGDRLIVFDGLTANDAYVVMSLEEYEKLAIGKSEVRSLTEDELLDKINRDIAIWKSERSFEDLDDNFNEESDGNFEEKEEIIKKREVENINKGFKNNWKIPKERKQSAEDIIEEDRQYLEEVPF